MRIFAGTLLVFLICCGTPETQPNEPASTDAGAAESPQLTRQLKVTLDEFVKEMQFLGEIHGFSGWYGIFAEKGYANAKEDALNQALKLGATHVVFEKQTPHYGGTEVHGRAYREKKVTRSNSRTQ